ncbi:amino acid permease [Clostridium massiliamazoniense]|uniref:amino acid permease n=1 Tax=Clostridium massiliamazoniense TaxID=1347366 RepID=UPI0006D83C73|nr:amino acid permease [Clostridium massiliamazoniense]
MNSNGNGKPLKKEIGLVIATVLVFSNIIGSGIFMIPSQLAQVGGVGSSLIAWGITGAGAIILALTFANLGSKMPRNGGLIEYSRESFGDFMGFMTAWVYWNGSWIGNATLFIVILDYLSKAFSILNNPIVGFIFCTVLIWTFTYINIKGAKFAGRFGTVLIIVKLLALVFFIVVGLSIFNVHNIQPVFPKGRGVNTIPLTAALTFWAFTGLESASVTSGEIKNPEKNVRRSTIIGVTVSIVVYLLISVVAMGAMPQKLLANSTAPITQVISMVLGSKVASCLTIIIAISICGSSIMWLLAAGRAAYGAGEFGVFPKVFAKIHPKYGTPHMSLIIGAICINAILILNFIPGFTGAYNFIVLLSTLSYMPVYAVSTIAEIMLMRRAKIKASGLEIFKMSIRPMIGFVFCVWGIYAAGSQAALYGFLLIMIGIPFYAYMKMKKEKI